jgi:hypothetical protein
MSENENDLYATHLPVLRLACERVPGPVIEFGAGYTSTGHLATMAALGRRCVSYEDNTEWADRVQEFAAAGVEMHYVPDLVQSSAEVGEHYGVCFVDSTIQTRAFIIALMRDRADVIVVHDTEEAVEWLYQMDRVLKTFAFRRDWMAGNQTTVVSDTIDPRSW